MLKYMLFLIYSIIAIIFMVRIIKADPWWRAMSMSEVEELLKRPLLMRLGIMDKDGYPLVHPVWFTYEEHRFYLTSSIASKKVRLLKENAKVYFVVDDIVDGRPRGVRGKGDASIIYDRDITTKVMREHIIKYIGSLDKPVSKRLLDEISNSVTIVIEPLFFATWIG
jgi:nitroimidazol reductase NimA-like FMN-containing flavoprotein (pyridoxamine 5'-phosphate oxidase superfamily)